MGFQIILGCDIIRIGDLTLQAEVTGISGEHLVRFTLTEEFWKLWEAHKAVLRKQGIRVERCPVAGWYGMFDEINLFG